MLEGKEFVTLHPLVERLGSEEGWLSDRVRKGLLKATQVGKYIRYRRVELENFLAKITEENPR
jgi:hypothetical protein